jgi:ElaB/YqjD/DUF883 family membrane-anchored ribosome-binding protein
MPIDSESRLREEVVSHLLRYFEKLTEFGTNLLNFELAIRAVVDTVREVIARLKLIGEQVEKILKAVTKPSDGKLADAIKHMEAILTQMAEDLAEIKAEQKRQGEAQAAAAKAAEGREASGPAA